MTIQLDDELAPFMVDIAYLRRLVMDTDADVSLTEQMLAVESAVDRESTQESPKCPVTTGHFAF